MPRVVGKTYSLIHGWPARAQAQTTAELEFRFRLWRCQSALGHVLFAEEHLPLFAEKRVPLRRVVATLHLPPTYLPEDAATALRSLGTGIVLCRRYIDFFEDLIGPGRVHFVPHGVDTAFFRPGESSPSRPARLLFAGVYLRNTAMLQRVIMRLHRLYSDLKFDLLIPEHARSDRHFAALKDVSSIKWHSGLDDAQLRTLYQQSYLALLPMNESAANNAIVEPLACGVPIVTTDVGGIRDYGGGNIFPLVANDDDDAMIELVERYLENPSWRDEVGKGCRDFAERVLAWHHVARGHCNVYASVVQQNA